MLSLGRNSDSDDTLLLSSVSALSGFALQCVKCSSYKNGNCVQNREICTAQAGEMCMIRRTWYSNESKYVFWALENIYFSFRIPWTISKILDLKKKNQLMSLLHGTMCCHQHLENDKTKVNGASLDHYTDMVTILMPLNISAI